MRDEQRYEYDSAAQACVQRYAMQKLAPLLEEVTGEVLVNAPSSVMDFLIDWFRTRCGLPPGGPISMTRRHRELHAELTKLRASLFDLYAHCREGVCQADSADETIEVNEVEEVQCVLHGMRAGRRGAIASQDGDIQLGDEVAGKTETAPSAQLALLHNALTMMLAFRDLETPDIDGLLPEALQVSLPAGSAVGVATEPAHCLIVASGVVYYKVLGIPQELTRQAGCILGETALFHKAAWEHNYIARNDCVLWRMPRGAAHRYSQAVWRKRRQRHEQLLKGVPLLNPLTEEERARLTDALKVVLFTRDAVIAPQGSVARGAMLIEEGVVCQVLPGPGESKRFLRYLKAGEAIDEAALLHPLRRQFDLVVCSESAKILHLSRGAVRRLVGAMKYRLVRYAEGRDY
eukprot:TRINITY_DN55754_c0_g1_i1.p1 TRINITY_DN55754_c0_g1~~TRINITY_DN55754_c0_g1_i1.p1  ORF type:complete len:404 (-),score=47.68 TRINITY_DN55754_c0_g1_i1:41-1252(-)